MNRREYVNNRGRITYARDEESLWRFPEILTLAVHLVNRAT